MWSGVKEQIGAMDLMQGVEGNTIEGHREEHNKGKVEQ